MEVEFEEEVEVSVECPKCGHKFEQMTMAIGTTEVEPPDHSWRD